MADPSPRGEAGSSNSFDVTVTFLEMSAPPKHYPPLPTGPRIVLLRTRNIPLHFYRYLMDRVGRRWDWVKVLRLDDGELAAAIHDQDRDIRVLYLDGAPAGFFDLRPDLPDEVEIAFFGMMEQAIGLGIGRWFLGAAIEAAWSYSPKIVSVQTCTGDHPAALPLYQKLGFRPIAQQQETVTRMSPAERAASVMRD